LKLLSIKGGPNGLKNVGPRFFYKVDQNQKSKMQKPTSLAKLKGSREA